jgi:hypothetical protein
MTVQRLRTDFLTGVLASPGLTGTTINLTGSGFGNITISGLVVSGTLTSGNYLPVTVNPAPFLTTSGSSTNSEIVWVYSYSANATTATVLRAQEGTSNAGSWAPGTTWSHGPTAQDFGITNQLANNDFPAPTASGQVLTSVSGGQSGSFTFATPTIPTNTILTSPVETSTIYTTGASGSINFDVMSSSVHYHTAAASGNISLNLRGNASNTFSSVVGSGQSMTVVWMTSNGATPYYVTGLTIDSNSQTVNWQGGTGWPTAGDPNALDVYSFTVLATAPGVYTVLGSVNKFV